MDNCNWKTVSFHKNTLKVHWQIFHSFCPFFLFNVLTHLANIIKRFLSVDHYAMPLGCQHTAHINFTHINITENKSACDDMC